LGAWQIKIFPYMGMLGFSAGEQAAIGSVFGTAASVVGLFFSNQFADRNFSAERFLAFSHLVSSIALVATIHDLLRDVLHAVPDLRSALRATLSVTNSLAFAHLQNPARDFGFVRMGGTVGWIVVSWPFIFLLGDKADAADTRWVFIVAGLIFVLAAYSLTLPHTPPRRDAVGLDRFAWMRAAKLLRQPFVAILPRHVPRLGHPQRLLRRHRWLPHPRGHLGQDAPWSSAASAKSRRSSPCSCSEPS
jgi:hypothetical protein